MVQPDIVKPEVFSKNKEPYVCVMQQTDVTKAVLGVSTELSPKPNKTWIVQIRKLSKQQQLNMLKNLQMKRTWPQQKMKNKEIAITIFQPPWS